MDQIQSAQLTSFRGIGGVKTALRGVVIPITVRGSVYWVRTQVIEGRAPFLIGITTLRNMKAILDCSGNRMFTPKLKEWITLEGGPLGVCQSAPCPGGVEPPCFACTPQH